MMKNNLNVRQMQAYAAICLLIFCDHIRITNNAITELIKHLLAMSTAKSLPDWEQAGTGIAITGRGDPVPAEVDEAIPENYKATFNTLVECCVEVGIVDMYGASTEQPRLFLEKCIGIVQSLGLELPPIESLDKLAKGEDEWGEPVSEAELSNLVEGIGLKL
ncbi:hypothetical protein CWB73_05380 [Pseudoalteromonas phenolica]|uniref:Uncharacterized protein n=1 Tax=Pseudoalteromonas phenolica TaxID=161398 RepID=A0A5S3YW94_9GAMM|nr:hypothetical protein [Pseudoalteromonas phenolica]TMP82321.1 hypothetical protein CWB73_05380 [Pseudoalteromonas phenolica]